MEEEPAIIPASAADAIADKPSDGKAGAAAEAVHEAAHAAAAVEADAVVAAAKVEEDANTIAEASGERAAKKYLEAKLAEIETAANSKIEGLKTWLDNRLKQIEGKKPETKPEGEAAKSAEAPVAAPPEPPANAPNAAPPKKKFRFV
jgi:hypothetical protein